MQIASPKRPDLAQCAAVTLFPADPLIEQLRAILEHLDTAARLAEGGYNSCHTFNRQARADLADLIAELSE